MRRRDAKNFIRFVRKMSAASLAVSLLMALPLYAQQPSSRLTVLGSSLLFPMVSDMARRFERGHAAVKIDVRLDGSGKAVSDLRAGAVDIGMVSRALLDNERDLYAFHVARDGIAVVVHRSNPINNVNTPQLRALLTGTLSKWRELGGHDTPVELAWRSKGQGSVEFILQHVKLKREQIGPHTPVAENSDAIKFVASNVHAVTLASLGAAERSAQAGIPIKLLAYNSITASTQTLQNRTYALSRPLTLLTRFPPQGIQKQFIDFALSDHVIDLQVKYGFVPYQE